MLIHAIRVRLMAARLSTYCFGLLFTVVAGEAGADEPTPEPSAPQVASASSEGENALRGFQIANDLRAELFAAEPMVANPVSFCLDEQGRVFVCESFRQDRGVTDNRGHDQAWLNDDLAAQTVNDRLAYFRRHLGDQITEYTRNDDRIRLLTDRDGDGRADDSTIFADHFNSVIEGTGAGVLAHRGNVYFTCIPKLWLLRDADNDGRADVRQPLQHGFGVRVAFRGHDLHGLCLGPDRRLYFSVGDRGYNVVTASGRLVDPESGAVFRCRLDGSELEVVATGLRNPQELAFDDFGNLFTGDNNSDSGDKARWVFIVPGGDSGWRMAFQYLPDRGPFNRERLWHPFHAAQPAYIVPPVDNFADGPSGLAYYPGVGLPESYRGRFFLCDFRGGPANSGILSFRVKPKGAFFELTDREKPIWKILATDVDFGPDGAIYVSDWVDGWNGDGKGRIYRITAPDLQNDPLIRTTRQLLTEGFGRRSSRELGQLLGHADRRVRLAAQFELADRLDAPTLTDATKPDESLLSRIHGIWGLGLLVPLPADVLKQLLADSEPEVRAQAALGLGEARTASATEALIKCLHDAAPRVRYHAAVALGRIGSVEAVGPLANMLADNADQDPIVRHGGIMGLTGVRDAAVLQPLHQHPSTSVRLATVVALRKLRSPSVSAFLHDTEPQIVTEAARAIHDLPLESELPKLAACLARERHDDALLRRMLNANFRLGGAEHARALASFAARRDAPEAMRLEALAMLQDWAAPSPRDRVLGMWRPIPKRDSAAATTAVRESLTGIVTGSTAVRVEGAKLAAHLGIAEAGGVLGELFASTDESGQTRADALLALANLREAEVALLLPRALRDRAAEVRGAARQLLVKSDAARAIVELELAVAAPERIERQAAVAQLAEIRQPEAAAALSRVMEQVLHNKIPDDTLLDVLSAAGRRSETELKKQLAQFEAQRGTDAVSAKYRETLHGGDAARGWKVFFERTEASCVRCHKIVGLGGEVGPDLSKIAADKSRQYLLEAIVDPNRAIAKGFESVTIIDTSGRIHVGVVKMEDERRIQLITADAKTITVEKLDIDERQPAKSPMPEDIVQKLSKFDIRDLVEFLAQQK